MLRRAPRLPPRLRRALKCGQSALAVQCRSGRPLSTARIAAPLYELLCDRHEPRSTALAFRSSEGVDGTLSFGALSERSLRVAGALRDLGIKPGDRVAVMLPKTPELHVCAVAIARLGAVYVPLFTAFQKEGAAVRVDAAEASAIITTAAHRHKFEDDAGRTMLVVSDGSSDEGGGIRSGDVVFSECEQHGVPLAPGHHDASTSESKLFTLVFTSGTTGQPKGVPVPLKALSAFDQYMREGVGLHGGGEEPNDPSLPPQVFWNAADAGWAYGLYFNVYGCLQLGIPAHALDAPFSAEAALAFMEDYQVTSLAAAPTVFRALRAAAGDGGSGASAVATRRIPLRGAFSAGEPLPPAVSEWFERAFGVPILNQYGQSEGGMMCVNHAAGPLASRPAGLTTAEKASSMGVPSSGLDLVVLRDDDGGVAAAEVTEEGVVGQLAVRASTSSSFWFPGYWRQSDEEGSPMGPTDGLGHYRTGDRAHFELRGGERLFFGGGRRDDLITSAGYRVGPQEIEGAIMQLPFVGEVAAVGVPDPIKGEAIRVHVVLKPEASASASEDEGSLRAQIRSHVREQLAKHLAPAERHVVFAEALPKTDSGKIRRNVLRAMELDE